MEIVLEDETLARIADVARRGTLVLLARGPARAAAEMGALTLKLRRVAAESYETAAPRHGPLELAGLAGRDRRRDRARDARARPGACRRLVDAGASVVVLSTGGDAPDGAHGVRIPTVDRLLASAVSIVPIQLLAWWLAQRGGRVPGAYTVGREGDDP